MEKIRMKCSADINEIRKLVTEFRSAIVRANEKGDFENDIGQHTFPDASCGTASELLAEYLLRHRFKTLLVQLTRDHGGHVLLVIKDDRVKEPTQRGTRLPDTVLDAYRSYGGNTNGYFNETRYEEEDVIDGVIVDITASQFPDYKEYYDDPVFVGGVDQFFSTFDFIRADEYDHLPDVMQEQYKLVEQNI